MGAASETKSHSDVYGGISRGYSVDGDEVMSPPSHLNCAELLYEAAQRLKCLMCLCVCDLRRVHWSRVQHYKSAEHLTWSFANPAQNGQPFTIWHTCGRAHQPSWRRNEYLIASPESWLEQWISP